MPSRFSLSLGLAVLAPLLALAGCGPKTNEFPPACPTPTFLRDLSDLIRYQPGSQGRDLTDLEVRARLTALKGRCEEDSTTALSTVIEVNLELFRGPAMRGRQTQVPIFLAILDRGEIVNKQIFPIAFEFPPNVDRATITTPPIGMSLPINERKSGADYGLIVGFQLTPEELANNGRRGL